MSNKEKKAEQTVPSPKKERVSVLEMIRKRTGLLVGIVGLALVIFILESLLGSGSALFGNDEYTSVGYINGRKIDRNEFIAKLENQMNNYRQRNQGADGNEAMRGQAIESIWNQYVVEYAVKPQFEKMGISVGEDELYQKVVVNPAPSIIQQLTDPNTGKLNEQFARPDGSLDLVKWKQAVQNVVGDQEMAVRSMEDNVKSTVFFEKFRSLVTKGLYVTKAEAKEAFYAERKRVSISFVTKSYDAISDSSVKVTESDLQKYYNDHSYEFINQENERKIEYVSFNVVPSDEDLTGIEKQAQEAAAKFKGLNLSEDSALMQQESENGNVTIQNFTRKTMIINDSTVFTASPGTVFGPYNEGAYFKVYKLQAVNSVADSARVRHILLGTSDPKTSQPKRTLAQAKKQADSIIVLLKNGQANFDSLVINYSDDGGSKENGGDYGWFDESEQFVEPFKNAGLMGTKGDMKAVETQFGYHIIEVLDVSKTRHTSYRLAQIFKPIVPSDETNQKIFAQANQFGGENNTGELFDKAVIAQKLSKRVASNIKEGDRELPGIEGAKELVRWAYNAKKGDVGIFSFSDKHLVAKLSGIRNKGVLPIEEVSEDLDVKTRMAKKTEMLLAEFNSKAANASNINDASAKLGISVKSQDDLNFESGMINDIGRDEIMVGTALGIKSGSMSKAVAGSTGVFILTVNSSKSDPEPVDLTEYRSKKENVLKGRSDYESFNALKDLADIEQHKSRID